MRINLVTTKPFLYSKSKTKEQQEAQKKTSFRGVDNFVTIKNLEGMVCACCGKPTMSVDAFVKALIPLTKSLKYNIENGALKQTQRAYPKIWSILNYLAETFPDKSLEEIIETDKASQHELKLAAVLSVKTTDAGPNTVARVKEDKEIDRLYFDTLGYARAFMEPASKVIKGLLPFKKYIEATDEIKKATFEQFEIYARKYPDKTLSEIVQMEEIYQFHKLKNFLQRAATREKLDYHFDNIRNLIEEQNPDAAMFFDELKESSLQMFVEEFDTAARLYKIKESYKKVLKEYGCENLEQQVMNELDKVPLTFNTVDSFFMVAHDHNYTDGLIIASLFNPIANCEQFIEKIEDGGNSIVSNKIVMHRLCAHRRMQRPYSEFIKYHPEAVQSAPLQVQIVADKISDGTLSSNLAYYPYTVARTYRRATDGAIQIDTKDFSLKEMPIISEKIIRDRKRINELTALLQQKNTERQAFGTDRVKLSEEIKKIVEEIEQLKKAQELDKYFISLAQVDLGLKEKKD